MSYVVESGASRSRRTRRRRALVTLAVVALMLFFAFWYAYSYYRDSDQKPAAVPPVTCTPAKSTLPAPSKITVNVYNSTNRDGLAAKTAVQVRQRGFKVSTVSNDPLQKAVAAAAEVRYGTSGVTSGTVVRTLVKGAKVVKDGRTDSSVDLVLGEKFTTLAPAPKASAASAAGPAPSPTC
jgi:hypothetical protein